MDEMVDSVASCIKPGHPEYPAIIGHLKICKKYARRGKHAVEIRSRLRALYRKFRIHYKFDRIENYNAADQAVVDQMGLRARDINGKSTEELKACIVFKDYGYPNPIQLRSKLQARQFTLRDKIRLVRHCFDSSTPEGGPIDADLTDALKNAEGAKASEIEPHVDMIHTKLIQTYSEIIAKPRTNIVDVVAADGPLDDALITIQEATDKPRADTFEKFCIPTNEPHAVHLLRLVAFEHEIPRLAQDMAVFIPDETAGQSIRAALAVCMHHASHASDPAEIDRIRAKLVGLREKMAWYYKAHNNARGPRIDNVRYGVDNPDAVTRLDEILAEITPDPSAYIKDRQAVDTGYLASRKDKANYPWNIMKIRRYFTDSDIRTKFLDEVLFSAMSTGQKTEIRTKMEQIREALDKHYQAELSLQRIEWFARNVSEGYVEPFLWDGVAKVTAVKAELQRTCTTTGELFDVIEGAIHNRKPEGKKRRRHIGIWRALIGTPQEAACKTFLEGMQADLLYYYEHPDARKITYTAPTDFPAADADLPTGHPDFATAIDTIEDLAGKNWPSEIDTDRFRPTNEADLARKLYHLKIYHPDPERAIDAIVYFVTNPDLRTTLQVCKNHVPKIASIEEEYRLRDTLDTLRWKFRFLYTDIPTPAVPYITDPNLYREENTTLLGTVDAQFDELRQKAADDKLEAEDYVYPLNASHIDVDLLSKDLGHPHRQIIQLRRFFKNEGIRDLLMDCIKSSLHRDVRDDLRTKMDDLQEFLKDHYEIETRKALASEIERQARERAIDEINSRLNDIDASKSSYFQDKASIKTLLPNDKFAAASANLDTLIDAMIPMIKPKTKLNNFMDSCRGAQNGQKVEVERIMGRIRGMLIDYYRL